MTTHVMFDALDPDNPATMSHRVIHGLLRERLGFDGLVISDDLEMKAIIDHFGVNRAVIEGAKATVDLFMVCHLPELQNSAIDALRDAVDKGEVDRSLLQRANARLDHLFARFVKPATPWNDAVAAVVGCAAHRDAVAAAAA